MEMNLSPQQQTASPILGEIITLNVGGKRFATSRQTLTWPPDSFFSSLLSGRIPSLKDDNGAIFIDRDPDTFVPILNYLRTKTVNLRNVELKALKHEAEFYGIVSLVKRLVVCEELEKSSCGNILFYGHLSPPVFDQIPVPENSLQPPTTLSTKTDFSRQVLQLTCHGNSIAVAYNHCICVLGVRESRGWEMVFKTPLLERVPQRVALNTRSVGGGGGGGPRLAAVLGNEIKVWGCSPSNQSPRVLTSLDMKMPVDGLFFVGIQLVGISNTGKVAVWQSVQQHWQVQELVAPICSYDMAGSFLLLGCSNGSIYYIDMEKFPVRMKDNDLLVTQLFEDPSKEPITALSVYITPNVFPGSGQNWMEVAYGTRVGCVRVVVRHPENIGQAPQIFQSFSVHACPIHRVVLGEKHLISVCAENHVRTWTVTRFRGRISTQPGSTPVASFKVLSLEGAHSLFYPINSIGPFGEREEEQVFIQRIIPESDKIFVRFSSTGKRVCEINSVDGSNISAYCVHECEAANRTGMRSRRFVFTGHLNGSVQVWDLTTALEMSQKSPDTLEDGPSQAELLEQLQNCDIRAASRASSTVSSRAPSPSPSLMSLVFPGLKQHSSQPGTPISSTPLLATRGATNIFQPIVVHRRVSATDSNQSLDKPATSVASPAVILHLAEEAERQAQHQDAGSQPEDGNETNFMASSSTVVKTPSAEEVDTTEGAKGKHKAGSGEGKLHDLKSENLHQRSHSNEIDYSTSGLIKSSLTAFRSPPGTISKASTTGFRPVSGDSAHSSLYSGFSDSNPFLVSSRPTSGVPNSPEPVELASSQTGSGNSPLSRHSAEGHSPPPWHKEPNGSISEYFDNDNDEVTDC